MKILIRSANSPDWTLIDSAGYNAETELQKLLADSPDLIDISEIRPGASPLCAAVREVGLPGSGYTDLLAFSPEGEIAVVECKLASSSEIKRTVIAQVWARQIHRRALRVRRLPMDADLRRAQRAGAQARHSGPGRAGAGRRR